MKETHFIHHNIEKWRNVEDLIDTDKKDPEAITNAYEDITADLAFARTNFPKSHITIYLNNLAVALHEVIYGVKRENMSHIKRFWTHDMPLTMWDARKELCIAFIIFVISALIGVISTLGDTDFPRIILGDQYMDMTLENISKGTPMAVYGGESEITSFLGITVNNIIVSFTSFAMGLLTSLGSGFYLFQNSIMLGAFETFFWQHGLLEESLLAVFLHGTIEMSSIIVAGAAGIALGNGWLFPGTYSRIQAFKKSAKRGMRISRGTVPMYIIAGFIEGFVTRHTEIPDGIRFTIIMISLTFVIYYYIVLPYQRHKELTHGKD